MNHQSPLEETASNNEVSFGARGFLSTLIGLIIGAVVGVLLAVFVSNRLLTAPDYAEAASFGKIMSFWRIIGGVAGATLGAFIGVLIGTTKREG